MGLVASMMHKSTHEARPAYELLETPPPIGDVCMAYIDIAEFEKMALSDETRKETLRVYHDVVHVLLLLHKGYEVTITGDVVLVAFSDVVGCIEWSLHMQSVLLEADWPPELLGLSICAPVYDVRNTEQLLWRGPRVRMGIHIGFVPPSDTYGPKSKPVYQGPVVDIASLLCHHAAGGIIVITTATFESIPSGAQQTLLNDNAMAGQVATIALDMTQAPSRKDQHCTSNETRMVEALPLVPCTLEGRLTTYVTDNRQGNDQGDSFFNNVLLGHPHKQDGLDPIDVLEHRREAERIDAKYESALREYNASEIGMGCIVMIAFNVLAVAVETLFYNSVISSVDGIRYVFEGSDYMQEEIRMPKYPLEFVILSCVLMVFNLSRQMYHWLKVAHVTSILAIITWVQVGLWPAAIYGSLSMNPDQEFALATVALLGLCLFHVFAISLTGASVCVTTLGFAYFIVLAYSQTQPLFFFYSLAVMLTILYIGRISLGSAHAQLREMININETAEKERAKVDAVVDTMIPHKVKDKLATMYKSHNLSTSTENDYTLAEDFTNVSVLFACVNEFMDASDHNVGSDVVTILYRLFKGFDRLVQSHRVFKVEQVGSVYMAAVGVPERLDDPVASANRLARLALDMMKFVSFFRTGIEVLPRVTIKVGLHSGRVRAGMLGKLTLHYSLFGDTVNTSARMMKYSDAGKIQMSSQTAQLLDKLGFSMECRGAISVKGKGTISTWWLTGLPAAKPAASDVFTRYIVPGILYPTNDISARPQSPHVATDTEDISSLLIEDEDESDDFGDEFVAAKRKQHRHHHDRSAPVVTRSDHASLPSLAIAADELVESTGRMDSGAASLSARQALTDTVSCSRTSTSVITNEEQIIKDPSAIDKLKLMMCQFWLTFDDALFESEFTQQYSLSTLPYITAIPGGIALLFAVATVMWSLTDTEMPLLVHTAIRFAVSLTSVFSLYMTYKFFVWNKELDSIYANKNKYPKVSGAWIAISTLVLDVSWAALLIISMFESLEEHANPQTVDINGKSFLTTSPQSVSNYAKGWSYDEVPYPIFPHWDWMLAMRVILTALPLVFHVRFKWMFIQAFIISSFQVLLSLFVVLWTSASVASNPFGLAPYLQDVQTYRVYEWYNFESTALTTALTTSLGLRAALLVLCMLLFTWLARLRERHARTQFSQVKILRINEKKETQLLSLLLPQHTVPLVVEGRSGIAEDLADVTVVQTDFAGFTEMSAKLPPAAVFHILSEVFGVFDVLTKKHGLFKVYLIGDAYVAVGGIPGTASEHRLAAVNFAYDCLTALERINISISEHYDVTMAMRVGVASGHAVAGVLGLSNPRYLLFGAAPDLAETMEQTGVPGRIHILGDVANDAVRSTFIMEPASNGKVTKPWSVLWDNKPKQQMAADEDEGQMESYFIVSRLLQDQPHSVSEHSQEYPPAALEPQSLARLSVGIPHHILDLFNLNADGGKN